MTAVAQRTVSVSTLFENPTTKKRLLECLPQHLTPERMIRIAVTEYGRNEALRNCDPMSFVSAIMESAQLGLEPASALHYAYLVPYKGIVKLMIGYRGYVALLRRHPSVANFFAHCVYEGDEFDCELGLEPKLVHKPKHQSSNVTHVYAVCVFKDGTKEFQVMTKGEVESIRDNFSRKDKYGKFSAAWEDSFDEMAKKTIIRRMMKTLPLSNEMEKALTNQENIIIDEDESAQSYLEITEGEAAPMDNEIIAATNEANRLIAECEKQNIDYSQFKPHLESGDYRKIVASCDAIKELLKGKK